MKIKKKDLAEAIANLSTLKTLPLEGSVSLSVVKLTKSLTAEEEKFQDARKEIMEAYCTKDESGNPIIESRESGGQSYSYYEFGTEEKTKEVFEKIALLEAEDLNLVVYKAVTEQNIEALKGVTAQQTNALLLLTE